MPEQLELRLRLPGISVREQNQAIDSLRESILANATDVSARIHKEDDSRQDLGSTLILLLNTPVIASVAIGIQWWIAKHGSKVVIETADGRVVATGDGAHNIDVASTVKALTKK